MAPRLDTADRADLLALRAWFPDRAAALAWGGPALRFPFDEAQFLADLGHPGLPGYLLRAPGGGVLAFGQYYERAGRIHLARLAVAPGQRGAGHGRVLLEALMRHGQATLGMRGFSLFVLEDNAPAQRLYDSAGFGPAEPPCDNGPPAGCLYLVRPALQDQ